MRLHHGRRLGGEEGLTSEEHDRLWSDLKVSSWAGVIDSKEFTGIDKQLRAKALKSGYSKRDLDALEFTYSDLGYYYKLMKNEYSPEYETEYPLEDERAILDNRKSLARYLKEYNRAALDSRGDKNAPQWYLVGHHRFDDKSNQILEQAFQSHVKGEDISDFKKKLPGILKENFSCLCKFELLDENRDVFKKSAELQALQKHTVVPIDYKLFGTMGRVILKKRKWNTHQSECWNTELPENHPYHPNALTKYDFNLRGEFNLMRIPRGMGNHRFLEISRSISTMSLWDEWYRLFETAGSINCQDGTNIHEKQFYHRVRRDFPWKGTDEYKKKVAEVANRGW